MELVRFLALVFTPALTGAARPGMTFAVVQLFVAVLVRFDWVVLNDSLLWLVSMPAIAAGLVLGLAETLAQHDPDVAELLRELHVDHVLGAFGTFSAALLLSSLGLPESGTSPTANAGFAAQLAIAADQPLPVQFASLSAAVGLNLTLVRLRAEALEFLDQVDLSGLWARVETGGIAGVLVLLPFLPVLMLGMILAATVALWMVGGAIRAMDEVRDRRRRTACPACGARVRMEATRCTACRGALSPTRLLGQPGKIRRGWRRGIGEVRELWKERKVQVPVE